MQPATLYLIGHALCSLLLAVCLWAWKVNRRWTILFSLLFFVSSPAVYLIWGPFRYPGLYAAAFLFFGGLAKAVDRFYVFLKTQEKVIRNVFWLAVLVFAGASILSTANELNLRRDTLTFWSYEAKRMPTAEAMNNLAEAYLGSGKYVQAQGAYQQAVRLDPKSIRAYEGLDALAMQDKQWEQVIRYGSLVIALDPQAFQAYLNQGEAFRKLGDSKQSVETYSRLLDLFPDDEKIYMQVIEAYGRAIADDPDNGLYKEKREEVLADFEQLSKRKNYSATDYYNLGFLYEQVGGKDEAMRFYTKAVQMQPDHQEALFNLANLYKDGGNYKLAMALYDRLVHFHPRFALGYLNMGELFGALGDQDHARQLYQRVINIDPSNGDAYYYLGYASESQGELNEAVNDYEKAVELNPKNAEAYYNLGNVYASLGQNGEAIASYLKTIAINPRHQNAFVNLSILSFKSRDFQGAIHYLEEAQGLGYNPPIEYLKTLEPYKEK